MVEQAPQTTGVTIHRVTTFEHAYDTALSLQSSGVEIVHGVCSSPYNGRESVHYWHAWVEIPSRSICVEIRPGLRLSMPSSSYYRLNGVVDSPGTLRRYTIAQVESLHAQHGHYGPWCTDHTTSQSQPTEGSGNGTESVSPTSAPALDPACPGGERPA